MVESDKRQRNRMTTFIGLSGWAKSGKDTVAQYLVENHGFTRISFADPMRDALLALDPYVPYMGLHMRLSGVIHFRGWDSAKRDVPEIRQLLQRFGTEVGRNMFGQNFWVEQAIERATRYEKVVFSDCRYTNEADAVKSVGGVVWRVSRPEVSAVNDHTSEQDLNNYAFDAHIDNDSTIENLHTLIENQLGLSWPSKV
jgi:hypothetical protein